jgi:NADPH2:quinone reductase
MRAITISQYGGPEIMQLQEIPVPIPAKGEILVKVVCAGINFMDIHTRQGKYATSQTYPVQLPCTLGMEGAGHVVAVGEGVERLKAGDRVAWCISWGSYAEFACVPEALAAKIDDDIAYDLAAAAMFQGSTAHYLLNDVAKLTSDHSCLVHAGSGSIGQLLIQLAKRIGATVFATGSTREKCDVAKRCGADYTMLYENGKFADVIRAATGGRGVDVVFDSVGKTTLRDSLRASVKRGLVVNYGSVSGSVNDLDPIELGEAGSLFLTRPRLADHMQDADTVQSRANEIFAAIRHKTLNIEIAGRYTLDNVAEGLAKIEAREQIGKSVLYL